MLHTAEEVGELCSVSSKSLGRKEDIDTESYDGGLLCDTVRWKKLCMFCWTHPGHIRFGAHVQ